MTMRKWGSYLALSITISLMLICAAVAQDAENTIKMENVEGLNKTLDSIWLVLAGVLVFFMNAGFGMLEAGFCRQKNAVNILAKNLIVFIIATIAFWAFGSGLMFGDGNFLLGTHGFFYRPDDSQTFNSVGGSATQNAKFFFQLVFAGTAATIVSGAVAERIKFQAFIIFSFLLVACCYPIVGHWIWGKGWLDGWGFCDFAGSTVVHLVGGSAGLVGAWMLGPRLGKYAYHNKKKGKIDLPVNDLSLSTLGCFILWLGWFGFNPGSTLTADPDQITHIVLTTNLAAVFGGATALLVEWLFSKKPKLASIINGVLGGLVSITASCAFVGILDAIWIGVMGGIVVTLGTHWLEDWFKVDDPVGAVPVHLFCGVWGTLAVGIFSVGPDNYSWYGLEAGPPAGLVHEGGLMQLGIQLVGILVAGFWTLSLSFAFFHVLSSKKLDWIPFYEGGIRVSKNEELGGLDRYIFADEVQQGIFTGYQQVAKLVNENLLKQNWEDNFLLLATLMRDGANQLLELMQETLKREQSKNITVQNLLNAVQQAIQQSKPTTETEPDFKPKNSDYQPIKIQPVIKRMAAILIVLDCVKNEVEKKGNNINLIEATTNIGSKIFDILDENIVADWKKENEDKNKNNEREKINEYETKKQNMKQNLRKTIDLPPNLLSKLSEQQQELIDFQKYLYANLLILRCQQVDGVSKEIKQKIKTEMFKV